jgi:hypothetical protein
LTIVRVTDLGLNDNLADRQIGYSIKVRQEILKIAQAVDDFPHCRIAASTGIG